MRPSDNNLTPRDPRAPQDGGKPGWLASTADYTRFVRRMKIILPVTAVLLLGLVVIWPQLTSHRQQFRLHADSLDVDVDGGLSVAGARYHGTDNKGQPYVLTARQVQDDRHDDDGEEKPVNLIGPQAEITLNSGSWLLVGADKGQYHMNAKQLELEGDVNLYQGDGYELHTQRAEMDLDAGTAVGDTPTSGRGPYGKLDARGFELIDHGDTVIFSGPAHLTLRPDASGDTVAPPDRPVAPKEDRPT